jgi:hypothetical protein
MLTNLLRTFYLRISGMAPGKDISPFISLIYFTLSAALTLENACRKFFNTPSRARARSISL